MSSSATGVGMPICFLWAILLILTQKSSQKFGDVLGIMVFRDKILAQHSKEIKELEVSKKFLEQEVAAYKGMLDDIKSLLENHETTKR